MGDERAEDRASAGGNLAGATPTPINRNDAVIAEIKTIEIDFEYVPMN